MKRWPFVEAAFWLFVGLAGPGFSWASPDWPKITKRDVMAAFDLIARNHPGAARELGDAAFVARLTTAKDQALDEANLAGGLDDYRRVMQTFAGRLDDPHLAWAPTPRFLSVGGAGFAQPHRKPPSLAAWEDDDAIWVRLGTLTSPARELVEQVAQRIPARTPSRDPRRV